MEKEKEIVHWTIPIPKALDEAVEAAIKRNWHRTKTEFVRELVRQELRRRGFHHQLK